MPHFNTRGHLKTAQHEGKVARLTGKPETACPYRGDGTPACPESSWRYGWQNPAQDVFQ